MSRHRNIRSMNYNEEYDTYYDVYGQSVEEEGCISPRTAAEFMYDRTGQSQSRTAYLPEDDPDLLLEEPENTEENLSAFDNARLQSCLEEIQNIVGETVCEADVRKAVIQQNFDLPKALDAVLKQAEAPKPQRVKRERQRQDPVLSLGNCDVLSGDFMGFDWGGGSGRTPTLSELLGTEDDSAGHALSLSQLLGSNDTPTLSELLGAEDDSAEQDLSLSQLLGSNGTKNGDTVHLLSMENLLSDIESGFRSITLSDSDLVSSDKLLAVSPLSTDPLSQLWGGGYNKEAPSLSQLAGLHNYSKVDPLLSALPELNLSQLALTPRHQLEDASQRQEKHTNINFQLVNKYLLNYPHDMSQDVACISHSLSKEGDKDTELLTVESGSPSFFGLFMCLREKKRHTEMLKPILNLKSLFDFNTPSPDDVKVLKRTNFEHSAAK